MSKPPNSTIKTETRLRTTYLPSECVRNIRKRGNMFVSDTFARQVSCHAHSSFYSKVLYLKHLFGVVHKKKQPIPTFFYETIN